MIKDCQAESIILGLTYSRIEGRETGINSKDQGNDLISPSPVRSFGSRHCKKKQAGCLLRGLLADLKYAVAK